jgi:hypothetical protein
MISRTALFSLFVIASTSAAPAAPAADFYPQMDTSVAGTTPSEPLNSDASNLAVAGTPERNESDYTPEMMGADDIITPSQNDDFSAEDSLPMDEYQEGDSDVPSETDDFSAEDSLPTETYEAGYFEFPSHETSNSAVTTHHTITSKTSAIGLGNHVTSTDYFPITDLMWPDPTNTADSSTEGNYFPITDFATTAAASSTDIVTFSGAVSETLPSFFAMLMALVIM